MKTRRLSIISNEQGALSN